MPSRTSARAPQTRAEQGEAGPIEPRTERKAPPAPHRGAPGDVSPAAPEARPRRRRPRLIVEGARPAGVDRSSTEAHPGAVLDYPIQTSKVQAPPLRDETLARDRLLEWLSVKIHRRVVLLVAEAGYGKTTLLADFSRRTRVRMLWYRLDRGDRDWVGFMAYLVATIRAHLPEFGRATSALLGETATAAPSVDTVLNKFLRELGAIQDDATAVVFDDFHLIDDSSEIRHILRELLSRAPERMSFVFASRRELPIRLARLRALDEVAELRTDDLRFDPMETERLFRETYEMRLEAGVLVELNRRTEGWAASLQLVRAALNERDPAGVRSFISSLSGSEGHLYEYLAEEVVGDLPSDLQQFLMRTSVLETIDLTLGPIAAELNEDETREFIELAEQHGLLTRGSPHVRYVVRSHPLVRDFLRSRLARSMGPDGVRTLHVRVAQAAELRDWQISARHYLAAGLESDARRVLSASIETVLATGAYAAAKELAGALTSGGLHGAPGLILESRLAQQRAAVEEGLRLAEAAVAEEPTSTASILNLVSARSLAGDVPGSLEASKSLREATGRDLAKIARAYQRTFETSLGGSLDEAIREIEALTEEQRRAHAAHYLGVGLLNLSYLRLAKGDLGGSVAASEEAISILAGTSSGVDLVSARLARSWALACRGDMTTARAEIASAVESAATGQVIELAIEAGQIEALLGDSARARTVLQPVVAQGMLQGEHGDEPVLARVHLRIRDDDLEGALKDVSLFAYGKASSTVAFEARRLLTKGHVLGLLDRPGATDALQQGTRLADAQGATLWSDYGTTLLALTDPAADPSSAIGGMRPKSSFVLSMLAEAILRRLPELDAPARAAVYAEAEGRPDRWLSATRSLLTSDDSDRTLAAAELLERIGEVGDIRRLRDLSRRFRRNPVARHGYALARRLAAPVLVEDLGRVRVVAGSRALEGGDVRRKVLALLCLLLSKPRFASTRDEVIDGLWPDSDPASALNSLNQTVYFLRRVFEPDYQDETSPGYVGQDGETIWLDPELIECRSQRCLAIIRSMPGDPSPEGAMALANEYRGRFALDFAYEEWSSGYRDSLHAGYLRIMEHAIRSDLDRGNFARGTFLAERAIDVDPNAEEIQVALVRLYRLSGAHAAAAEQYGHYAQLMRDISAEPLALADL